MAVTNKTNYDTREQYREAGNLNARIRLHQRFSTNDYGWYRWLVDRLLVLPGGACILELGCGPGAMWSSQIAQIPPGWSIVLSDFSPGMAREARHNLGQYRQFRYAVLDAQNIPFPGETFDAVIANHMLYHVADRPGALACVRSILRPGGLFFAATNGLGHLAELDRLIDQSLPRRNLAADGSLSQMPILASFSLDNGAGQLLPHFDRVQVEEYEDSLEVTEVQPLIDYIRSMISVRKERNNLSMELERSLAQAIECEIETRGAFHIAKRSGVFTAGQGERGR
jgi:ubiquinone/menaquinone biosynthesis C-methylase UbiE